jgi:hypothetical protein
MLDYGRFSTDLVIDKDTTINDKVYKKIIEKSSYGDAQFSSFSDKYIRETEDASQLYIWDGREHLIFDLNMKVGDTYTPPVPLYHYPGWDGPFVVDSVYVKEINDIPLKHIQFDYAIPSFYSREFTSKVTFIEGMGPTIGLWMMPNAWFLGMQELNCFHNSWLTYKNENIPYPCGFQTPPDAIPSIAIEEDYTIRTDENGLEINLSTDAAVQISLLDLSGKPCYAADFTSQKTIIIPTASFPKGIYLLKILYEKQKKTSVRKIIL